MQSVGGGSDPCIDGRRVGRVQGDLSFVETTGGLLEIRLAGVVRNRGLPDVASRGSRQNGSSRPDGVRRSIGTGMRRVRVLVLKTRVGRTGVVVPTFGWTVPRPAWTALPDTAGVLIPRTLVSRTPGKHRPTGRIRVHLAM